ncbi:T-related protein, partial [Fragariocoptes setiger]
MNESDILSMVVAYSHHRHYRAGERVASSSASSPPPSSIDGTNDQQQHMSSNGQQQQVCEITTTGPQRDNIEARLEDGTLWRTFNAQVNEMIVTKSGRRMFPVVRFTLDGLDPDAMYSVAIEFAQLYNHRWKFIGGEWTPSGKREKPSKSSLYLHPESPNFGAHWMKEPVSFSKTKLTNKETNRKGLVVLNSLHKYEPRIHIVKIQDRPYIRERIHTFRFPETQFIAVTAYQNENITKLKIRFNPFAKAFQDTRQTDTILPHRSNGIVINNTNDTNTNDNDNKHSSITNEPATTITQNVNTTHDYPVVGLSNGTIMKSMEHDYSQSRNDTIADNRSSTCLSSQRSQHTITPERGEHSMLTATTSPWRSLTSSESLIALAQHNHHANHQHIGSTHQQHQNHHHQHHQHHHQHHHQQQHHHIMHQASHHQQHNQQHQHHHHHQQPVSFVPNDDLVAGMPYAAFHAAHNLSKVEDATYGSAIHGQHYYPIHHAANHAAAVAAFASHNPHVSTNSMPFIGIATSVSCAGTGALSTTASTASTKSSPPATATGSTTVAARTAAPVATSAPSTFHESYSNQTSEANTSSPTTSLSGHTDAAEPTPSGSPNERGTRMPPTSVTPTYHQSYQAYQQALHAAQHHQHHDTPPDASYSHSHPHQQPQHQNNHHHHLYSHTQSYESTGWS